MKKTLLIFLSVIALVFGSITASNAEESIRYKSTELQTIKHNKWTTLRFKGDNSLKGNGARSLFCYQVALRMNGKKKPKYIKIRLARLESPLDTTATNIYPVTGKPSSTWVASQCWEIETNTAVIVQVRITGGSKSYVSDVRQFKMWTPGANYPADFSDFIPEAAI